MLAKVMGVISTILGIAMIGYIVWLTLTIESMPESLEAVGRFMEILVVYFRVLGGCIAALFLVSGIGLISSARNHYTR